MAPMLARSLIFKFHTSDRLMTYAVVSVNPYPMIIGAIAIEIKR